MNDTTLSTIPDTPKGALAEQPIDILSAWLDQAASLIQRYTQVKHKLEDAIQLKYEADFTQVRAREEKDFGTATIERDGFAISVDIPKKIAWDQEKLRQIADTITQHGDDPGDYIDVDLSVSERKYQAWPPAIGDRFEPARTVTPGKPRLTVKRKEA